MMGQALHNRIPVAFYRAGAVALLLLAAACSGETGDDFHVKVGDQEWTVSEVPDPNGPDPRVVVMPYRTPERERSDMAGATKTDPPESEAAAALAEYLKRRPGCALGGPLAPFGASHSPPGAVGWMPAWIVTLKCSS